MLGYAPGMTDAGDEEEKASVDKGDFCRWTGFRVGVMGSGRRSFGGGGGGMELPARSGELCDRPDKLATPGRLGRGVRMALSDDARLSGE